MGGDGIRDSDGECYRYLVRRGAGEEFLEHPSSRGKRTSAFSYHTSLIHAEPSPYRVTSSPVVSSSGKKPSPPKVTRPEVTQSLLLGQFFQDRGQYEEALRELEEAKGRDPDNADILTALQRVRSAKEAEDKLNRSP